MEQLRQNNAQKINLNILLGVEKILLDLEKKKKCGRDTKKEKMKLLKI